MQHQQACGTGQSLSVSACSPLGSELAPRLEVPDLVNLPKPTFYRRLHSGRSNTRGQETSAHAAIKWCCRWLAIDDDDLRHSIGDALSAVETLPQRIAPSMLVQ